MLYNRRQFLIFTGGLVGLSFTTVRHQLINNLKANNSQNIETRPSEHRPINQPIAVAPDGLYAPTKGDVRLVIISDLNSQYGSTDYDPEVDKAIALIPQWQPDLVLCVGDMVAGQKRSLTKQQIEAMWSAFDVHVAAPLRQANLPFGLTIGNHDGSGSMNRGKYSFEQERNLASAYWNNPSHNPRLNFIDKANFPFYYSFKQQDIFYLVWDASTHIIDEKQFTWVENTLNSSAAKQAKLRLAIGHLPLYPVAVGRNTPGNYMAKGEQLQSLLEQYHVHTYISGHHHAYYLGKKGQLELLHSGALGGGPRQLLNSNLPAQKTLTVMDISLDSEETLHTTYNMKTLQVVDVQTLPKSIGKIMRKD